MVFTFERNSVMVCPMNECIEIVADKKWKRKMQHSIQTLFRITFSQCYPRGFIVLLSSSGTGN